jgi:hypothetical protein
LPSETPSTPGAPIGYPATMSFSWSPRSIPRCHDAPPSERHRVDGRQVLVLSMSGSAAVCAIRDPSPAAGIDAVAGAATSAIKAAGCELAAIVGFRRCAAAEDRVISAVLATDRSPDRAGTSSSVISPQNARSAADSGSMRPPHGHDGKPRSIHERATRIV